VRRRSLAGRRALVTGAAGGIGTALAQRLARARVTLVLTDRRAEPLEVLARALPPSAVAATIPADLTQLQDLNTLAHHPALVRLDILIHNAGVAPGGAFVSQPEAAIEAALDVNLRAALILTRRLLPALLERPHPAVAIVASGAGLVPPGGLAAYAASKAGLLAFAQALRTEHRGRLTVTAVCPAFVRTDIVAHTFAPTGPAPSRTLDARTLHAQPLDGQAPDAHTVDALNALVHRLGVSPDRVARAVLQALRRGRRCVPVGGLTRALLAAHAVSPGLVERAGHRIFRALEDRGVLP